MSHPSYCSSTSPDRFTRKETTMGKLVDGRWTNEWYDTKSTRGRFVRKESSFRDWIRADGSTRFQPEAGRYHLYVSLACPWAHRTLIVRKQKRLEAAISVSVVHPFMGEQGWSFENPDETPGCVGDQVNGARYLHEIYTRADPGYTGRVTVPVLWDRLHGTIVSNESSEIIRMLDRELAAFGDPSVDLYPEALRAEIDEVNALVYPHVNNGVYRCGFATTQEAYEEAFGDLFRALDSLDERLARRRYLVGDRITEADWRLFTTLIRFDPVYAGHFKCNRQRIVDYPHLSGYLRELYQIPGVAETVSFEHIKRHYYQSHTTINPTGIVPLGPELHLDLPHGRETIGG
jgi:glutathionyl-hydroquinone reductase